VKGGGGWPAEHKGGCVCLSPEHHHCLLAEYKEGWPVEHKVCLPMKRGAKQS